MKQFILKLNKQKMHLFFAVSFFLLLTFPFAVQGAILFLIPQSQDAFQGETFIAEIRIDTAEEEINALEINLAFPPALVEALDINKGGSILSLLPEEPFYSNSEGRIYLIGGVPGGFKGQGQVAQITFRAKDLGTAVLNFEENSQVLLNDGEGTQADLDFLEANYEIIQMPEGMPKISSSTHPDQNKWSKNSTFHLRWDLAEGAEYSYILSKDSLAQPDDTPDRPEGELQWMGDMEYANLEDGIYYFFLRQKLPEENWSPKISFRAMVDATSPEKFQAEIGQDPSVFEGKYFLGFSTQDKTSGIDYYEVKEGKGDFKRAQMPYLLDDQTLNGKIIVKAVDKAGNEQISEIIPPRKPVPYLLIISIFIGFIVLLFTVLLLARKIRMPKIK